MHRERSAASTSLRKLRKQADHRGEREELERWLSKYGGPGD